MCCQQFCLGALQCCIFEYSSIRKEAEKNKGVAETDIQSKLASYRSKGNIPLLFKYTNKIHLTSKRISAIYKYINGNIYYANGTEVSRMKLHKTKIPTSSEPFSRQRTFCFGWCKQRSNPKEGKRGERGNPQRSNHNGKPAQRLGG